MLGFVRLIRSIGGLSFGVVVILSLLVNFFSVFIPNPPIQSSHAPFENSTLDDS